MQTTLLGIAIAIILALLTALIGPYFVDWGNFRSTFEAEASRLVGQPVRVTGPIDVRLLPAPSLVLAGIEIGKGRDDVLRARSLGLEFGLGALVRGEFRAVEARLSGPQIALRLNADGKVDLPALAAGFNLETLSVEKLHVEDGQVLLGDAASGSQLALQKLWFNGELRSLAGPFKGEGAFVSNGALYGYRLSTSRFENGAAKLKINLDPSDRPLAFEGDGLLSIEQGAPRFEGSVAVFRPVGAVMASGKTLVSEPWRATARIRTTAASALLEQIDVQYGPEDRVIKMTGTAELRLGTHARFNGVLSARQIDVDRLLHDPDLPRRLPSAAIRALADRLAGGWRPSIPVQIGIGIDALTMSGAVIQNLRGDIKIASDGVTLDGFEFRAPGATQVAFSGRVGLESSGLEFEGPVSLAATDSRALMAWLDGRADPSGPGRPLRVRGDVAFGDGKVAVERIKAEIDRKALEGRLAYVWAGPQRPARLEAEVNAAELDVDQLLFFGRGALSGTTFDRPGEIALTFDVARATVLGVEARHAKAKLSYDGKGLQVERLTIADLGGTALNASGRIDTASSSPRGRVALDVDARDLSGMTALLANFLPQIAPQVRRTAERLAPAKLRASLNVEPAPSGNSGSHASFGLGGSVGAMRISLAADAMGNLFSPGSLNVKIDSKVDSDDGGNVLGLLGLPRLLVEDRRPQQLSLSVSGPLSGDLNVEGRLAGEVDAVASGTLRLASGAAGSLSLAVAKADLRRLRPPVAGKAPEPLPLALQSRIAIAGSRVAFNDISGALGGSPLKGQLGFAFGNGGGIEGAIEAGTADIPALLATAIGMPIQAAAPPSAQQPAAWPAQPFLPGLYPEVAGRIDLKIARAAFSPTLVAKDFAGSLRLGPSEIHLENVRGELAGGQLAGQLSLRKGNDGVTARGRVALTRADAGLVMPGPPAAFGGRINLQFEAEGTGLSPRALVGSLGGAGVVTLENAQILGLDPKAFAAVIRAVDQGLPVDAVRVRDYMATALDAGRLGLRQVDATVTISAGQARVSTVVARGDGADVAVSGTYDLADNAIDARVTLTAPAAANASAGRPEVGLLLKGPLAAPKRTLDVAALSGWLALRSVERQSRRVEEAERQAAEHARREAERERLRIEAERLAAIKAQEEQERRRREEFQPPLAPLSPAAPFRTAPTELPARSGASDLAPAGSSAPLAPPLPPPIDIRPATGAGSVPRLRPSPPAALQPSSATRAPLDLGLIGSQ